MSYVVKYSLWSLDLVNKLSPSISSLTNSIGHVEKVFESTNRGDIYNQALPKSAVNSNWSLQKWICFALFDIDGVVEIHLSVLHHQPACQDRAVVVTPQPNSGKKKRNVLCKKIKIIAVFLFCIVVVAVVSSYSDPLIASQVSVGFVSQNFFPVEVKIVFT